MGLIELSSLGAGVAQNPAGAVIANTNGTIRIHGTINAVTVFSAESGGTSDTTGTFTTDSFGRIPGWVADDQIIDITIPPAPTVTVVVPPVISRIFISDSAPTPPTGFGEYVWFEMDGSGNLLDIQSGTA